MTEPASKKRHPGSENLRVPTSEEAREMGRRGGRASAEARRRRRTMAETLRIILAMPFRDGDVRVLDGETVQSLKGANLTLGDAILMAAALKAAKGDIKALQAIRDTVGEMPIHTIDVRADRPLADLDTDELKRILDDPHLSKPDPRRSAKKTTGKRPRA